MQTFFDAWQTQQKEDGGNEKIYDVRIPQPIIDYYMPRLKGVKWNFFCHLVRRANFNPNDEAYGKCWLTHRQIAEATGLGTSELPKYDKELMELGLINVKHVTKRDFPKKGNSFTCIHIYSINFFSVKQIRDKLKKSLQMNGYIDKDDRK